MGKNKKDQELNSEDAQVKQPETDESVNPQTANESREQSDKTAQMKTKENSSRFGKQKKAGKFYCTLCKGISGRKNISCYQRQTGFSIER